MTLDELRTALRDREWVAGAEAVVRADPAQAPRLFARAERVVGRDPLPAPGTAPAGDEWTAGQGARALLLAALADPRRIAELYHRGDAAERLAVLRALPLLPIGDAGVPLLHDALRTNDTRLVSAALGPYASRLDQASWRQGVVKCVFMGLPLTVVHDLDRRADPALLAMLTAFCEERVAAGRSVPADVLSLCAKEL